MASCILARVEFVAAIHRHRREGKLSDADATEVLDDFQADQKAGLWQWFELTQALMNSAGGRYRSLDPGLFVRTNDALHLTCARENGFHEIYSNDRHVISAAAAFSLRSVNVVP